MKLRIRSVIISFLFFLATCSTTAFASSCSSKGIIPEFVCSPWAREVLQESYNMRFGPKYRESDMDMTKPIIRWWAFIYTERFIAMQYRCTPKAFYEIINCCNADEFYSSSTPVSVFSDDDSDAQESTALYYLGVVKGRGDGTVGTTDTLTRQEAAVILERTYKSYGGTLESPQTVSPFVDDELIAPWAKNSIYALANSGIFLGYDDGRFSPLDEITCEQYITALYRLYANMPVCVKNGNISSIFTYDEIKHIIETWDADPLSTRNIRCIVRGDVADYYELEIGNGTRYAHITPALVFHSGVIKYIDDLGVCDNGSGTLWAYRTIENPHFSDDGKTLYYSVFLPETVEGQNNNHGHQAGTYNVAINIDSLAVNTEFTPIAES